MYVFLGRWKDLLSRWCLLMDFGVLWNELICRKREVQKMGKKERSVFCVCMCYFHDHDEEKKEDDDDDALFCLLVCGKVVGSKKRRGILSYFSLFSHGLPWSFRFHHQIYIHSLTTRPFNNIIMLWVYRENTSPNTHHMHQYKINGGG